MTSFRGRVALTNRRGLGGFVVQLGVDGETVKTTTHGNGEFVTPEVTGDCVRSPHGELSIFTPDGQPVLSTTCHLDGRYLGVTVARDRLPAVTGRSLRRPPPAPPKELIAPEHGEDGSIELAKGTSCGPERLGRIVATADTIAVASESALWTWTLAAAGRTQRPKITRCDGRILDIADYQGQLVVLVASGRKRKERLVAIVADGEVTSERIVPGSWTRLAATDTDDALVLASQQPAALGVLWHGKRGFDTHEWDGEIRDVAFFDKNIVVLGNSRLTLTNAAGEPERSIPVSSDFDAVAQADVGRFVLAATAKGRSSLVSIEAGALRATETIYTGRGLPVGWWRDRDWLIALLLDRLRWWRLPPIVLPEPKPASAVRFIGPT